MKIIKPSFEILTANIDGINILKQIERAGRVAYKSEDKITDGSCIKFAENILKRNHLAVIEHVSISVKFICDRGVSHELVRHRICSFTQESTRYCNYSNDKFGNELTFIQPCFWNNDDKIINEWGYGLWLNAMKDAEDYYLKLISKGAKPQEARSVLPNSLKTEIVVTANLREWKHIFFLRCAPDAHPQMRELMIPLREKFMQLIPEIFVERNLTGISLENWNKLSEELKEQICKELEKK